MIDSQREAGLLKPELPYQMPERIKNAIAA
jgi:hypothetical protein